MKLPSTANRSINSKERLHGNKNAEKKTRKIELGWMNYKDSYVQTSKIEDFECMLSLIGSEKPLESSATIGSLYEQTNHKILRVYLCTKPKDCDSDLSDETTDMPPSPTTSSSSTSPVFPRPAKRRRYGSRHFSWSSTNTSTEATPASQAQPTIDLSDDDEVIVFGYTTNSDYEELVDGLSDTLIYLPEQDKERPSTSTVSTERQSPSTVSTERPSTSTVSTERPSTSTVSTERQSPSTVSTERQSPSTVSTERQSTSTVSTERQSTSTVSTEQACPSTVSTERQSPSTVSTEQASNSTVVSDFFANPENVVEKQVIVIRKTHCVEDMIQAFTNNNILDANILLKRVLERGEVEQSTGGADMDELLSILSSHDCCVLPTEHNLQSLVEEIAHKEMVQEPAFIIKCWKPILGSIGQSISTAELKKILDDLKPKARNVTKCIKFPGRMSLDQQTTSNHLLRFVRERDEKELGLFLRYCTGSDLFLSKTIKVTFTVEQSQYARAPLAHTCSCSLELASDYKDYTDFRTEFISVLKSGVWVMDLA
ncbi:uncharacterized protein si:ch73-30l9.1 [Scomber scombrus]|uniref:Uncharacterized protein si:ch73-30l9.1 n=1 Tax=Scomber scombrus TaxID=13677 RepID=A0AAV1PCR0_SCOSC